MRPRLAGASFYRFAPKLCRPGAEPDDLPRCKDALGTSGGGSDYTAASIRSAGPAPVYPSGDRREPLPSAFAFRWLKGGAFNGGTRIRVWKESNDAVPDSGRTRIDATGSYVYYAWDEDGRVLTSTTSPGAGPDPNLLPLATQEIDPALFRLPTSVMSFGWAVLAFYGSIDAAAPLAGGYGDPAFDRAPMQGWIEIIYTAGGRYSVGLPALALGNYLCDRQRMVALPRDGRARTDLGSILY